MNSDGVISPPSDLEPPGTGIGDPAPAPRFPDHPAVEDLPRRAVVVEFAGARGGVAPLSWGQASIWRLTTWRGADDPYFNMPWVLPVYGRRDLGAVVGAVRRLVERHETLRTNFRPGAGGMAQHVTRSGRLVVEVVEGDGGERPMRLARRVAEGLAARVFDYAAELPVRCAVVTVAGRPRAVAFGLSHLAADGGALDLLAADWRDLLGGTEGAAPVWQPMDQARFEREGAGAARGERAFRHWREVLERVPRSMFDYAPGTGEERRFVRVRMVSVALGVAAEAVAARWRVSSASVLTVASAVVLSVLTGHRRVAMQLIAANRHDARIGGLVGPAAQDGVFALEVPVGAMLGEVTRAGHRQALTAYRHALYEPLGLMAMREELGRERGGPIDLSAYFNDTRGGGDWPDLPAVEPGDPAAIAALTARTTFSVVGSWEHVDATTAQFITGQARDACELHLLADTAYLPRTTVYTLLRGMETLLVRAVAGDVPLDTVATLCGITPVERPPAGNVPGPGHGSRAGAGPRPGS